MLEWMNRQVLIPEVQVTRHDESRSGRAHYMDDEALKADTEEEISYTCSELDGHFQFFFFFL